MFNIYLFWTFAVQWTFKVLYGILYLCIEPSKPSLDRVIFQFWTCKIFFLISCGAVDFWGAEWYFVSMYMYIGHWNPSADWFKLLRFQEIIGWISMDIELERWIFNICCGYWTFAYGTYAVQWVLNFYPHYFL